MNKRIQAKIATALIISLLSGCGLDSGADDNSDTKDLSAIESSASVNAASESSETENQDASDVASSDESSDEEEIDEELKAYQEWIDEPANQMVLLKLFESPDEIEWIDVLYEAAMRDFIGHPFSDSDDDMISDFLALSGKSEEKTYKVRVITDDEIAEYIKEKTGSSFSIDKDEIKENEDYWFYSDKFDVWYCYCWYIDSYDYECYGISEYEFECLDVAEDGDEITLHVRSYTYTDIHKAQTEIKMKKSGDGYQILSNVIQWEGGAIGSYPVNIPKLGDDVTVYIYDDYRLTDSSRQPTGEYSYSATVCGDDADYLDFSVDESNDLGSIIGIKEIGTGDYDMDRSTDLIVIVEFEKATYPFLYGSSCMCDKYMSEYAYKEVTDISCESILDYLTGGHSDTGFTDYKEAFRIIARNENGASGGSLTDSDYSNDYKFKLVYFNDDDIPELVFDHSGYWLSVYEFIDGYVYCIGGFGYGAFGKHGYDYFERCGVIINDDVDHAGDDYYTSYYKYNEENHTIEEAMYHHGINVDSDEYGEEGYYIYEDGAKEPTEVTEKEYNEALSKLIENASDDSFKSLNGELSYEEIMEELK